VLVLDQLQRATLRALCDTFFPTVRRTPDPDGFWRRAASDLKVDSAVEKALGDLPEEGRSGLLGLLDAFSATDLVSAPAEARARRAGTTGCPSIGSGGGRLSRRV